MGCSNLVWDNHRLDRWERICNLCHLGVEDEYHIIFECPVYKVARKMLDFRHLFLFSPTPGDYNSMMESFFAQEDQNTVCNFVNHCMYTRKKLLSIDISSTENAGPSSRGSKRRSVAVSADTSVYKYSKLDDFESSTDSSMYVLDEDELML